MNTLHHPLVTIILPVFNGVKYIGQAIQSVINQTYGNWELIIVDDGSTDGTEAYLCSLDHEKIKIVRQENKGVSAARNRGLSLSRGEYLTFLDADDVLPAHSLEARACLLEARPEVDVVDGVVRVCDETLRDEQRRYQPYYEGNLLPRLLKLDDRVFFGIPYMFRSSLLGDVRFAESMTHAEDLLFFVTLAYQHDMQYAFVEDVIYICRTAPGTAMTNLQGLEEGYLYFVRELAQFKGLSSWTRVSLRFKIARILLLSWRAEGRYARGVFASARALLA